jgi:hypothetical protein
MPAHFPCRSWALLVVAGRLPGKEANGEQLPMLCAVRHNYDALQYMQASHAFKAVPSSLHAAYITRSSVGDSVY